MPQVIYFLQFSLAAINEFIYLRNNLSEFMLTIVFGGKIVPPNQTSLETVLKLEMDPILMKENARYHQKVHSRV